MYDYCEMQEKKNAESECMFAGCIVGLVGAVIGGMVSVIFFLLRRFDILSSGVAAMLFYVCTYQQKLSHKVYIIAVLMIWIFSMVLQYIHRIFRILYGLLTCGVVAFLGVAIIGYDSERDLYLVMGICFLITAFLGAIFWNSKVG